MDSMLRRQLYGSLPLEAARLAQVLTSMENAMEAKGTVTMIMDGVNAMLDGQGMTARRHRRGPALGAGQPTISLLSNQEKEMSLCPQVMNMGEIRTSLSSMGSAWRDVQVFATIRLECVGVMARKGSREVQTVPS